MDSYSDTDSEVQDKLDKLFSALSLEERAERYFSLWHANRVMLYEGVKIRNPEANEEELKELFSAECRSTW